MASNNVKLSQMLETAVVAARLAGQRAMEEIRYVKTTIKNKTEVVTQADLRCQQIIIDRIKETYPDHGFIGEEGRAGAIFKQPPRASEAIWWVIDPIDGTANFSHRMPLFTVSIAALQQGWPVAGVVFDPATDSMFTAVKAGQAQLNGRRINACEDAMSKFTSIGLDSHYDEGVPGWVCEIMRRTRFRNLGTTALQLAYVGNGSLIATVISKPRLWDIAAGALIAETAGAVVTDWHGNQLFPVDADNYQGREYKVLAANRKVHKQLLEMIAAEQQASAS